MANLDGEDWNIPPRRRSEDWNIPPRRPHNPPRRRSYERSRDGVVTTMVVRVLTDQPWKPETIQIIHDLLDRAQLETKIAELVTREIAEQGLQNLYVEVL